MIVLNDKYDLAKLILDGIIQEELDNNYDYSQITDMSNMFKGDDDLKTIPLLDTSNVTNMQSMFEGCEKLEEETKFNINNVKNIKDMYVGCRTLEKSMEKANILEFLIKKLKRTRY